MTGRGSYLFQRLGKSETQSGNFYNELCGVVYPHNQEGAIGSPHSAEREWCMTCDALLILKRFFLRYLVRPGLICESCPHRPFVKGESRRKGLCRYYDVR